MKPDQFGAVRQVGTFVQTPTLPLVQIQVVGDPNSSLANSFLVFLHTVPFAGDVIELKDGSRVRVIRRVFVEKTRNQATVDARLTVRVEEE